MPRSKQACLSYAERVLEHIPTTADATPVSVATLCAKTGLTTEQVRLGVAELRDLFTSTSDAPLLSGPRGYAFSFDAHQNEAFRQSRAKTAHTIIRRSWHGAIKRYLATLPPDRAKEGRLITKGFERVLDDLGELVGVGASGSTNPTPKAQG